MNLKKTFLVITSIISLSWSVVCSAATLDNPILEAMQDELARIPDQLKMGEESSPYFVSYRILDTHEQQISAIFGALVEDQTDHDRQLRIELRVGDYRLDNSNFIAEDFRSAYRGFSRRDLPLEDDYDAIRFKLWLATDRAYKIALEQLAKKKATIENRLLSERPDDFSKTEPTKSLTEPLIFSKDVLSAESIQKLSALFKEYPLIQSSKVRFTASVTNQYYLDTEGSMHIRPEQQYSVDVVAETQNKEGATIEDYLGFHTGTAKELTEALTEIEAAIKDFAKTVSAKVEIKEDEAYVGPVMFTGQAAAQLFYELLGRGVSDPAPPLFENEMMANFMKQQNQGFLAEKIGHRVLPTGFSVFDDPNLEMLKGKSLIGGFAVDDQGVKAQKVTLVEDGQLKTVLMSRTPTKKIAASNGHARGIGSGQPAANVSNLIVESVAGVTDKKLHKKFLALCKDRDLDYGIVVTRLQESMPIGLNDRSSRMFMSFGGPDEQEPILSPPAAAYKLFADGKTAPCSASEFSGLTYKLLKDIVAQGSESRSYNLVIRQNFSGELPISVTTPDVIIDELEVNPVPGKPTKLPLVKHPYFDKPNLE